MRTRAVDKALRNGPLTEGQKEAVKLDPVRRTTARSACRVTRARARPPCCGARVRCMEKKGYELRGLAPSASAARTLEAEAGIASETLQRFLMRVTPASPRGA